MTATATAIPIVKTRRRDRPPSTRIRQALPERLAPYLYIAPFFVIFAVVGLFPLLFTFYVALFDWHPIGDQTFVGLANFERLFQASRFWNAFVSTSGIFLVSTIPPVLPAIRPAHLLNPAA